MSAAYKRPIREDPTCYERTGIPCGDPRRFESRGITRMAPNAQPFKHQQLDAPGEDIETEGERQLQQLAKKQLDTQISLNDLSTRKRSFTEAKTQHPLRVSGAMTLSKYQDITGHHNAESELRQMGLTEEEIHLKLGVETEEVPENKKRYGIDPETHRSQLEAIDKKLEAHMTALAKPNTFVGAHYMSRQERDLEAAITQGDDKAKLLANLITDQKPDDLFQDPQHPMNHLDDMWNERMVKWKEKKKHNRKAKHLNPDNDLDLTDEPPASGAATCLTKEEAIALGYTATNGCRCAEECDNCSKSPADTGPNSSDKLHLLDSNQQDWEHYDSKRITKWPPLITKDMRKLIDQATVKRPQDDAPDETSSKSASKYNFHLVTPVSLEDIKENRLSIEELKQHLPKHKDFSPGEPSHILYLQNLPSCSEEEILSLFIRFQKADMPDIEVKKMKGRMRGQAFVTLDSQSTAKDALELLNGYQMKGKPILIKYGKRKSDNQATEKA